MFKKLCVVFAAVLLSLMPVVSAFAAPSPSTSNIDLTCNWYIEDGTLYIENGIADFDVYPWADRADEIINVKTENVVALKASGMFEGLYYVQSIDVSGLDTSRVEDFSKMFAGCVNLTEITGTLDVSNAASFDYMFENCISITSLNLKYWTITKNVTVEGMFAGCLSVQEIYVGTGWNYDLIVDSCNTFLVCNNLEGFDGINVNSDMFETYTTKVEILQLLITYEEDGIEKTEIISFDSDGIYDLEIAGTSFSIKIKDMNIAKIY